jgi:hypothetical protein
MKVLNLSSHYTIFKFCFKDREVGEKIKVPELRQLILDDPAFQNLTKEEEDKMKMDVLELRELKKIGAHPTNKSVAQDYGALMVQMNNEASF